MYLGNDGMDLGDLVARLQAQAQSDPDRRIYVRGDKTVPYGRMIEVMGTIKQGGFNKVALLVEQTDGAPGSTSPAPRRPRCAPAPPPAPLPTRASAAPALRRRAAGHDTQRPPGPWGRDLLRVPPGVALAR